MNCSEYLVDFLINHGVTDVFGYAGGYIVPFMDALYFRKNEISVYVCYNEQGCALAASGYARTSGKLGVYFTTSGPGAVNGLGGLADAWFDGFPIMGICGNVPTNEMKGFSGIRQNGFQEMDIVSMTRNITKYSVTANSSEGFPDIVNRAYNMALLGRKGGVIIDFPLNIQQTDIISR
ncbi:MAG TPA: thiamine pyrophosphate-binding protein [Clostridiales bacterium]|nr:thiamine pyrophosphate-binding protein [Eubacteriales bacterium]HBR31093.1 thiamine pyrophosphate-binding protein [Clostridiales bacterium]